jgi:hypothetical protein
MSDNTSTPGRFAQSLVLKLVLANSHPEEPHSPKQKQIPHLAADGHNFRAWRNAWTIMFKALGIYHILERPENYLEELKMHAPMVEPVKGNYERTFVRVEGEQQAQAHLLLMHAVEAALVDFVAAESSAAAAWMALEAKFGSHKKGNENVEKKENMDEKAKNNVTELVVEYM